MSPLRVLGFCYLATASCVALALAVADQAQLRAILDGAGASVSRRLDENIWRSMRNLARSLPESLFDPPRRQAILDMTPPEPSEERSYAQVKLPPIMPKRLIDQEDAQAKSAPVPSLEAIMPATPSFDTEALTPAEAHLAVENAVQGRLEQSLSPELRANFDLFLYVST